MFQPRSVTTTSLVSVNYCYVPATRPSPPAISAFWPPGSWCILYNSPTLQYYPSPLPLSLPIPLRATPGSSIHINVAWLPLVFSGPPFYSLPGATPTHPSHCIGRYPRSSSSNLFLSASLVVFCLRHYLFFRPPLL